LRAQRRHMRTYSVSGKMPIPTCPYCWLPARNTRRCTKRGKRQAAKIAFGAHVSLWLQMPPSDAPGPGDVTAILRRLTAGEHGAADDLLPVIEKELRRIAGLHMR